MKIKIVPGFDEIHDSLHLFRSDVTAWRLGSFGFSRDSIDMNSTCSNLRVRVH